MLFLHWRSKAWDFAQGCGRHHCEWLWHRGCNGAVKMWPFDAVFIWCTRGFLHFQRKQSLLFFVLTIPCLFEVFMLSSDFVRYWSSWETQLRPRCGAFKARAWLPLRLRRWKRQLDGGHRKRAALAPTFSRKRAYRFKKAASSYRCLGRMVKVGQRCKISCIPTHSMLFAAAQCNWCCKRAPLMLIMVSMLGYPGTTSSIQGCTSWRWSTIILFKACLFNMLLSIVKSCFSCSLAMFGLHWAFNLKATDRCPKVPLSSWTAFAVPCAPVARMLWSCWPAGGSGRQWPAVLS